MGLSHVIPELLQRSWKIKEDETMDVYSVDHSRSFCYIDDAVEMLVRIISSESCMGKVLNLGQQNQEVTMMEVAETVLRVHGKKNRINPLLPTPGSPYRRVPDMGLTKELTGFEAKIELEKGIQCTSNWYINNIFCNDGVSAL
tara:strand:+ start:70 stop:498 length:429 start_codon:yes stop_codon:yes gene_type:complete